MHSGFVRRPIKVLIAHGDAAVMGMVRRALVSQDLRLFCARDGLEALAVVKASGGHPDVLITDVRLDGIDGLHLAARLAAANPNLGVIVLSSECEGVVFLDSGMAARSAFVRPPVRRTTLIEMIRDMARPLRSAAARSHES